MGLRSPPPEGMPPVLSVPSHGQLVRAPEPPENPWPPLEAGYQTAQDGAGGKGA